MLFFPTSEFHGLGLWIKILLYPQAFVFGTVFMITAQGA
jgi:hypothetical protein